VVNPLRVAFFGTPAFASATLERLEASAHEVTLVVTQPDRPRGRGQRVSASPVKELALRHDRPVLQPERLKDDGFVSRIEEARVDLAVVAAYGRILPASLLAIPRLGCINVHASLLPRWRGAAPVHRAILAGDRQTGVTIMRVVAALDAGPMLARAATPIDPDETSVALEARLASMGADLLVDTVDRLARGPIDEEPQDESAVTYANRLERSESRIDWGRSARDVHNQIRGLQPWPVAAALYAGKRLMLLQSMVEARPPEATPGTILEIDRRSFVVACRDDAVRILRVQLEGRGPVTAGEFLNGHRLAAGDQLLPLPAGP
jgi:methionyl-tRNA formyltransferase